MGKTDYHIHSDFSADSRIKLVDLIPLAAAKGYSAIAITEHLDLLPQELTIYGVPSLKKYKVRIEQLQKSYPAIKLIVGIEVGDFQAVKPFADSILQEMKFALVLGSVHFVRNHTNIAIPFRPELSAADVTDYYEQNLHLVETCAIDILAHLGVYKRYYAQQPVESHCQPIIRQIFQTLIQRGIALEINFSCFRKTYQSLLPELNYLQLYKQLGGRLVSIGSDSHTLEHFDDNYHYARQAITDFGFELIPL